MLTLILARMVSRQTKTLQDSLSEQGLQCMNDILTYEGNLVQQFILQHATPELRRLEGKSRNKELSVEETKKLQSAKKTFVGLIVGDQTMSHEASIVFVNMFINITKRNLDQIMIFKNVTKPMGSVSSMIFGERIDVINASPAKFSDLVIQNMHRDPADTLDVLHELLERRVADTNYNTRFDPTRICNMLKTRFTSDRLEEVRRDFSGLVIPPGKNVLALEEACMQMVSLAMDLDSEYKPEIKEYLGHLIPSYTNQNLKLIIWILTSFISYDTQALTTRVSYETLAAFYRKAVELNVVD